MAAVRSWMWLLSLLPLCGLATAQSLPSTTSRARDLLASSGPDRLWLANVSASGPDTSVQTDISYRTKFTGNSDWTDLPQVSDRVVSMAATDGELIIVLSNGQWQIADDSGFRSGPTTDTWDTMFFVAAGGDVLWAVVKNSGSATQQTALTRPSTRKAEPVDARLMICERLKGAWKHPIPLPPGIAEDPAAMSLCVVDSLPVLAWRQRGGVAVSELSSANVWSSPKIITTPPGAMDFDLLSVKTNSRALLWIAPAVDRAGVNQAGEIIVGNDFSRRIPLQLPQPVSGKLQSQTVVAAFGNLRWLACVSDRQVEEDFNLDEFPRSLPAAKPIAFLEAPAPQVIPLTPWIFGDAALVALVGLTGWRQRKLPVEEKGEKRSDTKPRLAPLGLRFVAGMVDLAPILAVFVVIRPAANSSNLLSGIDRFSLAELFWISLAAYILHTLVAELICGQSIGKIIFNLRVMSADGKEAGYGTIVVRNVLRVIDGVLLLPLLLVLVTPMQQRVGDLLAGTVVVALNGEEEEA